MGEPELHNDFMTLSDCFVYENEVIVEYFDFGRVEYIDSNEASGCVKTQLKDMYLLYYKGKVVTVYNRHPKEIIYPIKLLFKEHQTDTTRVSGIAYFDSKIKLTIDRLCKDNDDLFYNEYVWWRNIDYATTPPYKKTKNELLYTLYNWNE